MGLTKAYARIEELEQENAQLRLQIDMLKMERENDGWVLFTDKLPPARLERVLVSTFYYTHELTVNAVDVEWAIKKAEYCVAWRPLPEPYKGDADATK